MKILPTLNIQHGKVVPVVGDGAAAGEVMDLVGLILDQGFHRLGLVDVDAARGQGHNRELIAKAIQRFHAGRPKVCVQVGGGIRSSDQAQFFLDHGATWLTVGTILQRSPLMVEQLLARFREHLTAAVDVRAGAMLASGWGVPCGIGVENAGVRIAAYGFKRLLFMDVPGPEGTGPDFATARLLAQSSRLPLFMGGSLRTLEELAQARETPGLQGVALDGLLLRDNPSLSASLKRSGC